MIGFKDKRTEKVFLGEPVPRLGNLYDRAQRKLRLLEAADSLQALAQLPSNRLEALRGDRKGQHSLRINKQWRICFMWTEEGAEQVEIVDCH